MKNKMFKGESMKNKSFEASKGFTLVELMVVIAIIGILAVVALGFVRGAQQRAKDSALQAAATNLTTALESYYTVVGKYPESVEKLWGEEKIMDKAPGVPSGCEAGNSATTGLIGSGTDVNGTCGISYQQENEGEGYNITVKYILKRVGTDKSPTESIKGGASAGTN